MYWPNLKSVALTIPKIIAIKSFGWGLQTCDLGKAEA